MATEKRLIDANALFEEIERVYADHYEKSAYKCIHDFFNAMRRRIRQSPTVDAVEVVRCKDCEHQGCFDGLLYCEHTRGLAGSVSPDAFCSYGERRTDNVQITD